MKAYEIEAWALRVIDAVKRGERVEDHRVELKAKWTDPVRAARQLAGHANSAAGDRLLWLIGVDEASGVVGAAPVELANWYPKVEACFAGGAPTIQDVNVVTDAKTIVALLFETDRAPFVVRNPEFGKPSAGNVELEVPWREASRTRSARREDLIRILAPLTRIPDVEVIRAILMLAERPLADEDDPGPPPSGPPTAYLEFDLYFVPRTGDPLVIPFHHCKASALLDGGRTLIDFPKIQLWSRESNPSDAVAIRSRPDPLTIQGTPSELIIRGPGKAALHAETKLDSVPQVSGEADIRFSLGLAGALMPLVLAIRISASDKRTKSGTLSWRFRPR
jgi:hypothetical protein